MQKLIPICPKCGEALNEEIENLSPGYNYACLGCDEDFYKGEIKWERYPTDEEIKEYMDLHNGDEVGINNQWNMEEAKYFLLLSDEYN